MLRDDILLLLHDKELFEIVIVSRRLHKISKKHTHTHTNLYTYIFINQKCRFMYFHIFVVELFHYYFYLITI